MMVDKRGELTTQQIVGLIVLIVSFSIILLLIFRLNPTETADKQVCHNSVVLKSKSNSIAGDLDCRTNYVCISGGGECEGINPTITRKIDMKGTPEEIRNETMKEIAEEIADCWWMFGEGKVDYVDWSVTNVFVGKMACALCSKIAFDKSFGEEVSITYGDLYNFMNKEKKDNSQTYLQYLKIDDINKIDGSYLEEPINFENPQYVLTGISEASFVSDVFGDLKLPSLGGDFDEKDAKRKRPIQVLILKDVSEAKCDEFVTKA